MTKKELKQIIKEVILENKMGNEELHFKKDEGYWDVTKYSYGGDFKRFKGNESGHVIEGGVKTGSEVRIKLSDNREIVCQASAISNFSWDEVIEMHKKVGRYLGV